MRRVLTDAQRVAEIAEMMLRDLEEGRDVCCVPIDADEVGMNYALFRSRVLRAAEREHIGVRVGAKVTKEGHFGEIEMTADRSWARRLA